MPKLEWDRTLETCLQRNRNALLIAGQPPYWRFDQGLGAGLVPCLDHEDIISMLEEITPGPDRIETVPGCRSFRLLYGSDPYRVDMLGEPTPLAVVLTRLPLDAPAVLREGRDGIKDGMLMCRKSIGLNSCAVTSVPETSSCYRDLLRSFGRHGACMRIGWRPPATMLSVR
jgi:hypothetical protein